MGLERCCPVSHDGYPATKGIFNIDGFGGVAGTAA